MADAFNNLSDAASSIISFCGVKLAGRPADKEHPFGHGRFEYIAALIVSFIILMVGFSLFKNSFGKVLHPETVGFRWSLVIILVISVFVKIWLSLFNKTLGVCINSKILIATSADARNDVIVTGATIISILFSKFTGITIDGWIGTAVSVFVLYSGFTIAKDTLMPLLGEAVPKEVYETIAKKVESYEGIHGSHDLIVHNYGPSHIMGTIHVEVSNDSNIEKVHDTIDMIERDILKELGIFLVIHMDPIETNNEDVLANMNMVVMIIRNIEPNAHIHDFRVVNGEHAVNFIFDLVIPYSYKDKEKEELLQIIEIKVKEINHKCNCIITVEKSYIAE